MRGCDFYFIFFSKKDLLLDKLKKMNFFIYIFCYKVSDFFFFLLMYRLVQREQHIYRELYIQIQILIFSTFITTYFPALEKYEKDIENTHGLCKTIYVSNFDINLGGFISVKYELYELAAL